MGKGYTKRGFVRACVMSDNRRKHVRNEDNNQNKEEHNIVVKIHDFFHRICCGCLEIHLSGSCGVQYKQSSYTCCEHVSDKIEEEQRSNGRNNRSNGSDIVSACECVWVIRNTTRHSSKSKEMHGEERKVHSNEKGSEMNFP